MIAADLQSPPEELPRLIAAVVKDGFDVGTGRRVRARMVFTICLQLGF